MTNLRRSITHVGIAALALFAVGIGAPQAGQLETPGAGIVDADNGTLASVFDFPAISTADQQQQNPLNGDSQSEAKRKLAVSGLQARLGKGDVENYDQLKAAYEQKFPNAPKQTSDCSPGEPCKSNSVNLTQVAQEVDWWCGPATAYMVIDQLASDGRIDDTRSVNGSDLSQSTLAASDYTDADGGGGTYRDSMKKALNSWTGTNYYDVLSNPSPRDFKAALTENIDRGQSFAVAALESAGGPHYNGHPYSMTVDHWVAAKGYDYHGKVTEFADPGTSIWSGASETFNYNTSEFVENFVQPEKAIVW